MIRRLFLSELHLYLDDIKRIFKDSGLSQREVLNSHLVDSLAECCIYGYFVEERLVGLISLYINNGPWGRFGRIENVAVDPPFQGRGYGKELVEHAKSIAFFNKCYRVDLSCSDIKKPFYEKCGFEKVANTMKVYNV